MKNMNNYYEFKFNGEEVEIYNKGSKYSNKYLIAYFNTEENDGFICKDAMKEVRYKNFNKFIKGLYIHREIEVDEDFISNLNI